MPSLDLISWLAIALLVYAWWPGTFGRERWTGRLLTLCLLSPGLRYLSSLFSFPIRLKLSTWAGYLLNAAGLSVQVDGNVLIRTASGTEPIEMAVDPACMGLQLTGVSLLVSLFSLIWQERLQHKRVLLGWLFIYEMVTLGLTVLCNLFRIVLLVAFTAMPGTLAHEVIGLVCVGVYTWGPSWWMASMLVKRHGKSDSAYAYTPTSNTMLKSAGWSVCLLAFGIGFRMLTTSHTTPATDWCRSLQRTDTSWHRYTADCHCKPLQNGFVQLAKPGLLIYIKPQTDWISADHSPMVCWLGSGYELRHVREILFNGHPAYAGELQKKGQILHTVWWFSNGAIVTTSQLNMRAAMINGTTGFVLVNITSEKPLFQV
ncbi:MULTISPECIES: exosortase N [unclassified Spirosoma]|uniref:exosortase N n=1 Tax=unclassified Spirosoma TaxID=2621999 RepID=UPI0009642E88|nr:MULTISPECIES: exosortase N [unclassified Spirosoma]MBN8823587.1 exosortase N [Spirosoma sp.]OJW76853.1 MAG: exosortase N [Spirosoma sp. 48-14]